MSLYMAEAELLAELELAVRLGVLVQEGVQSQGRWGWMRNIGVDHNTCYHFCFRSLPPM